jgi:phosphate/sulfate permease
MDAFLTALVALSLGMLVWDCVEVGRNDAANLVNAVFGARVLTRRAAVWLAGAAVLAGASLASPVMETARSGIFDPGQLDLRAAMVVYVTAYIVDTVLLYTFSAYGMPISTTASLVFELMGAAIGASFSLGIIHWPKAGTVLAAIVMSVFLTGIAGFLVQRMFRAAIQDDHRDHLRVLLHGPWIAGIMLTWLAWFMVLKGMNAVPGVKHLGELIDTPNRTVMFLLVTWAGFTFVIHMVLAVLGERGTRHLFGVCTIVGMLCLSFAFGQNDLANCASPGLSAFWLQMHAKAGEAGSVGLASKVPIPVWALAACGFLMVLGMTTRSAQRVTRAAVNTGSQFDHIALYAPGWCRRLARWMLRHREPGPELAPPPERDPHGKRMHFDPLRASVIMAVSASVIAFASSEGLPVSTTYVTFAAVIATGMGDRTLARGDGDLKIGRAIWVVTSWFGGGAIAVAAAALVAALLVHFTWAGLAVALGANLLVRRTVRRRADVHEQRFHPPTPGGDDDDSGGFSPPGPAIPSPS